MKPKKKAPLVVDRLTWFLLLVTITADPEAARAISGYDGPKVFGW